jgi:hypothetical protein
MAENSGVALDFLTQIVNVQWSGLAVEFGPRDEDAPRSQNKTITDEEESG